LQSCYKNLLEEVQNILMEKRMVFENLKHAVFNCCLENINDDSKKEWFQKRLESLSDPSLFYLSFGLVNRKLENKPVVVSSDLETLLKSINPSFLSSSWSLIEFCRLALLLQLNPKNNKEKITTLLASSDMKEQIVIYKAFQYIENAEDFLLNVIDGIRTNIIDVFDAIALENAFPFTYFSEDAWNHMVLKAIFMERPIYRIYGIDERRNAKLAGILHDFVQERWAAGRTVTPELWRMIEGFDNAVIFEDLKKVISGDDNVSRMAAIKVLEVSEKPEIKAWLSSQNHASPNKSWDEIGRLSTI
jgi:hypothetical protein